MPANCWGFNHRRAGTGLSNFQRRTGLDELVKRAFFEGSIGSNPEVQPICRDRWHVRNRW
jgi:hypothetical protein